MGNAYVECGKCGSTFGIERTGAACPVCEPPSEIAALEEQFASTQALLDASRVKQEWLEGELEKARRTLHDADTTPLSSVAQEMAQLRDNAEAVGLALEELRAENARLVKERDELEARHEQLLSESERVLPKTEATLDRLAAENTRLQAESAAMRGALELVRGRMGVPWFGVVKDAVDRALSSDAGNGVLEAMRKARQNHNAERGHCQTLNLENARLEANVDRLRPALSNLRRWHGIVTGDYACEEMVAASAAWEATGGKNIPAQSQEGNEANVGGNIPESIPGPDTPPGERPIEDPFRAEKVRLLGSFWWARKSYVNWAEDMAATVEQVSGELKCAYPTLAAPRYSCECGSCAAWRKLQQSLERKT